MYNLNSIHTLKGIDFASCCIIYTAAFLLYYRDPTAIYDCVGPANEHAVMEMNPSYASLSMDSCSSFKN